MRIGVVGCGAAGLVSARVFADKGFEVVVFEKSNQLGGTWVYTDDITNKSGEPIHSAMYKNLRTNLPKEIMEFKGLHYPQKGISFLPAADVLQYLCDYASKFDLKKYVKFETEVINIKPGEGGSWEVETMELNSKTSSRHLFDAILICNGHYSLPVIPEIKGSEEFKGTVQHSHKYRRPEVFEGQDVLVIGIGPSGQDIAFDLASHAAHVYLSHHGADHLINQFPENVIHKPDLQLLTEDTAVFIDGSSQRIDAVLYCTGYSYHFPFLSDDCDIRVEENYVTPLFKQFINIKHPTMALIGLPFRTFIFPLFEMQVECFCRILEGTVSLPDLKGMEEDRARFEALQAQKNVPKRRYHLLGAGVKDYVREVEEVGRMESVIPPVIFKIFARNSYERKTNLANYRNYVFSVVDSENFTVSDLPS